MTKLFIITEWGLTDMPAEHGRCHYCGHQALKACQCDQHGGCEGSPHGRAAGKQPFSTDALTRLYKDVQRI